MPTPASPAPTQPPQPSASPCSSSQPPPKPTQPLSPKSTEQSPNPASPPQSLMPNRALSCTCKHASRSASTTGPRLQASCRASARTKPWCAVCKVPGGANVGWSARAVLRDKEVFGGDVEVFSPGRWLEWRESSNGESNGEKEAERLNRMERTVELVFGQGKWGCLGKPISLLEINKVLVELFTPPLRLRHPQPRASDGYVQLWRVNAEEFVYEDITADRYHKRGLVRMVRCGHE
ncbi:hypothetical protein ACJ73_01237 [Blastomyces percursus]|uniref:Cytochrome P450 n=1 Tax=Blastomyces percursus TaxID=1658174 RepID=A0A1J9RIC3_9EURO|nr:hypothetical protein ACJ73_01237 [Blastomyces percursus]